MHTTNAYAYNSVTQENNNKNQTVNKKQQSINNWSWHIPEITTTHYILSNKVRTMKLERVILYLWAINSWLCPLSLKSYPTCLSGGSKWYRQFRGTVRQIVGMLQWRTRCYGTRRVCEQKCSCDYTQNAEGQVTFWTCARSSHCIKAHLCWV